MPTHNTPRLAVRAILLHQDRLLLVNAWPDGQSDLWCAPGGGVEPGMSLPDNLSREIHEETGMSVRVGPPCLVNEFHDPDREFHQVEVFFRCQLVGEVGPDSWIDPEGIVTDRRWATKDEMQDLRVKPDSLAHLAWQRGFGYDPLERVVR